MGRIEDEKIEQRKINAALTAEYRANGGKIHRFPMGEINQDAPIGYFDRQQKLKKRNARGHIQSRKYSGKKTG